MFCMGQAAAKGHGKNGTLPKSKPPPPHYPTLPHLATPCSILASLSPEGISDTKQTLYLLCAASASLFPLHPSLPSLLFSFLPSLPPCFLSVFQWPRWWMERGRRTDSLRRKPLCYISKTCCSPATNAERMKEWERGRQNWRRGRRRANIVILEESESDTKRVWTRDKEEERKVWESRSKWNLELTEELNEYVNKWLNEQPGEWKGVEDK